MSTAFADVSSPVEQSTWICSQCETRLSAERDFCPICTCRHEAPGFSPLEVVAGILLLPTVLGGLGGLFYLATRVVEAIR